MIHGKIVEIQNHGSLVMLVIEDPDTKKISDIPVDHRMFSHILEDRCVEHAKDMVGLIIDYNEETKNIFFLEDKNND